MPGVLWSQSSCVQGFTGVLWDAENVLEGEYLSNPVLLVASAKSLINEQRCLPRHKIASGEEDRENWCVLSPDC